MKGCKEISIINDNELDNIVGGKVDRRLIIGCAMAVCQGALGALGAAYTCKTLFSDKEKNTRKTAQIIGAIVGGIAGITSGILSSNALCDVLDKNDLRKVQLDKYRKELEEGLL